MASLRDIRKRIRSVKSTQKITRAMKLVSAAKLKRAQTAIVQARPYADSLHHVISRIASRAGGADHVHPLLARRASERRVMIVSLSSDRGMCGAFNANVMKKTERVLAESGSKYEQVELAVIGRRARDYFRKKSGITLRGEYSNNFDKLHYSMARGIADGIANEFVEKDLDAVYLIYNVFKSAMTQEITMAQLLPIPTAEVKGDVQDYLYEPSRDDLLDKILPQYLATQVWRALLESVAAEHGARMTAMENATKNAADMIDGLTLVYNRARQAAITKELMEIISGSEAQKG